jgi:hypothetical protein
MSPKSLFYNFSRVHKCNWAKERMGKYENIALKPLFEVGVVFHNFHISFFWLFWTISPKRMNLMIWLGTYF